MFIPYRFSLNDFFDKNKIHNSKEILVHLVTLQINFGNQKNSQNKSEDKPQEMCHACKEQNISIQNRELLDIN